MHTQIKALCVHAFGGGQTKVTPREYIWKNVKHTR